MNLASTSSATNRASFATPSRKPTTASMRIAYKTGYKAYKNMQPVTSNPYAEPRLKELWDEGFSQAAGDSTVEEFEVHH